MSVTPVELFNDSDVSVGTFATLQAAVDAASDNFRIEIMGTATLREQVVIDGLNGLTINGNGATIEMVDTPVFTHEAATDGGARDRAAVVTVRDGSVNINDLDVDGRGLGDAMPAGTNPDFEGVLYWDAEGTLDNVNVTGTRDALAGDGDPAGAQRGNGIVVIDDDGVSDLVTIANSSVADFQKTGIIGEGSGLSLLVSGTDVTGAGFLPDPDDIAQNGIQLSNGVAAVVVGSIISEIGFARGDFFTAGVLSIGASFLQVEGSTFLGATDGVSAQASTHIPVFVTGGTDAPFIQNNAFTDTVFGIVLQDNIDDPTVVGNTFTTPFATVTTNTGQGTFSGTQLEIYGGNNDFSLDQNFAPFGTDGINVIFGTPFGDNIDLDGGPNVLFGEGGDDTLEGDDNDDFIDGGADNDDLTGRNGDDELIGGLGDDTLRGGGNDDILDGGEGDDVLNAGNGNDEVLGGDNNDTLLGGGGADVLDGGEGDDSVNGGGGNDQITFSAGVDFVDGGAGNADELLLAGTIADYDIIDINAGGGEFFVTRLSDSSITLTDNIEILTFLGGGVNTPVGPVTDQDGTADAVDEGLAAGATVGVTAEAIDPDLGASVTYSLTDDAGGAFTINPNSGVVTTTRALDREGGDPASLDITVEAMSDDLTTSSETFTIAINDVDEDDVTVPVDTNAAANTVAENAANGTTVGITANATDADATDDVTYSLFDDASGQFTIDPDTGVVTVNGAIDREAGATRDITVRATSDDASFEDTDFTIDVTDVNEFNVSAPVDSDAAGNTVTAAPNAGDATGVTASSSDDDATNNTVTYSLLVGDDDFDINPNSGVVTVDAGFDVGGPLVRTITVQAESSDGSTATSDFDISLPNPLNVINGTPGVDKLDGTAAGDSITGFAGKDRLNGNGGDDVLVGNEDNDKLNGNAGNDTLQGDEGLDILTGGDDADTFVLNDLTQRDNINDFDSAEGDVIGLDGTVFGVLGGTVDAGEIGTFLVYNAGNGRLYFDAAGTGDEDIEIARFRNEVPVSLDETDFDIV